MKAGMISPFLSRSNQEEQTPLCRGPLPPVNTAYQTNNEACMNNVLHIHT